MKKSKVILGLIITILGGSLMIECMISGISHFTENLYDDFQTFNIELQAPQAPGNTSFFSVEEGQIVSVWLRYANRQFKNETLKITVSFIDEDKNIIGEFVKDFQFGYIRNSAKKVKFFKLGEYKIRKEFRGHLQYELNGTWTPTKTSALVLRTSPPVTLPLKQICFFLVGIFIIIVGIETIAKNFTNMSCRYYNG